MELLGAAQASRGLTINSSSFNKSHVLSNLGKKVNNIRQMEGEFDLSAYNCTDLKINFTAGLNVDYVIEWYWEAVDYSATYGTHESFIRGEGPDGLLHGQLSPWLADTCVREPGKYGG